MTRPVDPDAVLVGWLRTRPALRDVVVSADWTTGRTRGQPAVVLDRVHGARVVRHRLDTAAWRYHVYGPGHETAAALAHAVREQLLEDLPATSTGGVQVTDVREDTAPVSVPDPDSREWRYIGAVTTWYFRLAAP